MIVSKHFTIFIVPAIMAVCSGSSNSYAASEIDITNKSFSSTSPNCEQYSAKYKSSVDDANNKPFSGATSISVKNGRCYFESNAIPNHDFNDGAQSFRNDVKEQKFVVGVTAQPTLAGSSTPLSLAYDNAIFLNGVKLDLLAAAC